MGKRDIRSNPPPQFGFLAAQSTFNPLAARAHFLDGFLHGARGLPCLLRLIAHFVILAAGYPRPVPLSTAARLLFCLAILQYLPFRLVTRHHASGFPFPVFRNDSFQINLNPLSV